MYHLEMKRRQFVMLPSAAALAMRQGFAQGQQANAEDVPPKLLLKEYRPRSIYRTPKTDIKRATYPIIDVHCHGARPIDQLDEMVRMMDVVGVVKAVIITGANSGDRFSDVIRPY